MNQYNGEIDIFLYGKTYPMKIDMGVIAEFQSETNSDYHYIAVKAINALRKCEELDVFDQSEKMTEAVSMLNAVWLFYLAAKKMDSTVTFDEMQEAVLLTGPLFKVNELNDEAIQSYPILFAKLALFSILGVEDNGKKQSSKN